MGWMGRLFRKSEEERRLDQELRDHLERQAADYIAAGVTPAEARRRAQLEFGGLEPVKEECRESRRSHLLETLFQDLHYGIRMLRKNAGFTVAAVATLALGIGANTAIFSIVNAALLRPLPYKDSARIVDISTKTAIYPTFTLGNSWPAFERIRSQASALEESAVYIQSEKALTGQGNPAQLKVTSVSDGFFEELGGTAQRGRLLGEADQKEGQNFTAVISDGLWRTRYGSDPSFLGKTLILDKQVYTVVGIAARGFAFPEKNDVWIPVSLTPQIQRDAAFFALQLMGKLRRGQTIEQLNSQLETIAQRMMSEYPELKSGVSFPARYLLETRVERTRTAYLVLLGASTLVLLIACANLASLLLARGSSRQREMAVRAALGATRGRLLRQGLAESCLIALLGAAAGVVIAAAGVRLFRAVAPADTPRLNEISLDGTLLWFSLATSLVAGVLFGIAPARRAARMDPQEALKEGSGAALGGARNMRQSRLGNVLVVVEVALAFVLLIGSALMTQTVHNMLNQNPGFQTEHLLTLNLPGPVLMAEPGPQFVREQTERLKRIVERVRMVPGVAAVTASDHGILTGMLMMQAGLEVEAALPPRANEQRHANVRYVHPSYFRTLRMPLLSGRDFAESDTRESPRVAIVNEAMAREYWGSTDVLGKRLSVSKDDKGNREWYDVIGVVADVREVNVSNPAQPEYYFSLLQSSTGSTHLFVRTLGDPEQLAGAISREIWSSFPDQPVTGVTTMSRAISESVGDQRLRSVLLAVFAGIGFSLALLGVYGVISYSVSRRVQEIGIRAALGATPAALLRMVIGQGLLLVAAGVTIGAAGAFGLGRVLASQLYGVEPTDMKTFVGAAALLILVACLACGIPARRAMRVDPMIALRYE